MRLGILFAAAALLLANIAIINTGWYLLFLWPSLSAAIVSAGYLGAGARVFGKKSDGTVSAVNLIVLLPYLAYSWLVWHAARLIKREHAYDALLPDVLIGRRLLASEYPVNTATVVDLTCEFPEPAQIRRTATYVNCPILDAALPDAEQLISLVRLIRGARRPIYIHCAQGHGRTGLVAAALLLANGSARTVEEAVAMVQAVRPLVRLKASQMTRLREVSAELVEEAKRHG
jgi:hypothetical protein